MRTLFIGRQLILLDVVDSTNNYAAMMLNTAKLSEGAVIMAQEQTAGRGQRGTVWQANPGENLTFSIVLKPDFLAVKEQFLLSQIVALAVYDTVAEFCGDVQIKWPNDVLAGKKKIAGILIENNISGERISSCIAGIGLNVNQQQFPDEIPATSLMQCTKQTVDRDAVLEKICSHLEKWYLALRNGKKTEIRQAYLQHLLFLGKPAQFRVEEIRFTGIITGIDESGRLKVTNDKGESACYDVKEISLLI